MPRKYSVVSTVDSLEPLTSQEEDDRHRLELKVDRGFYEVGCALRELKLRRLFRSTHHSWEDYCRWRFRFGRDAADDKIMVAEVVENLESNLPGNARQNLPTSERQALPLTKLTPDEQCQVWQQVVEVSDGKIPSGRLVKDIVKRLKERDITPPPIPFQKGDVVLKSGLGNPELKKYDGQWALAVAASNKKRSDQQ